MRGVAQRLKAPTRTRQIFLELRERRPRFRHQRVFDEQHPAGGVGHPLSEVAFALVERRDLEDVIDILTAGQLVAKRPLEPRDPLLAEDLPVEDSEDRPLEEVARDGHLPAPARLSERPGADVDQVDVELLLARHDLTARPSRAEQGVPAVRACCRV